MVKYSTIVNFSDNTRDLKQCDIIFFESSVDRTTVLDGKLYSPLIDSVREDLEERGFRCSIIEHPWSIYNEKLPYVKLVFMNRRYFFATLCDKILAVFGGPVTKFRTKLYLSIFAASNPRLIVTIGANDALCEAARALNIFHVELLHGIGYTSVQWGWETKRCSSLPQGILSLDAVSTVAFSSLEKCGIFTKTIPHPFVKRFLGPRANGLPVEWQGESGEKNSKKKILVSLQWAYAGDHGKNVEFSNILKNGLFHEELEQAVIHTKDTVFWHFRFHPVQLSSKYHHLHDFMDAFVLRHTNCEWRRASSMPYPLIATMCDGNIGMSSMSCYDAAYMGIKSLMLCPTIQDGAIYGNYFQDLVDEKYLEKEIASVEGIVKWISEVEKIAPRLQYPDEKDGWESAVDWMLGGGPKDARMAIALRKNCLN